MPHGPVVQGVAQEVPNSSGTAPPLHAAPVGATDCHHHIFDPRFPPPPGHAFKAIGTVADYLKFRQRIGLSRSVVIAAFMFGDDNACVLDALRQFGDSARGVGIARPGVSQAELDRLHAGGIRGLRFYVGRGTPPTHDEIRAFGRLAADRDWHLQIVCAREGDLLADWEPVFDSLPCRVVIDHFGYPSDISDPGNPTALSLLRLLENGRTYVKLSGVYIRSVTGYPGYADCDALGRRLVQAAPERMLWGTDWPHTGPEAVPKPDGARLFDQLSSWSPDAATRTRILVDNPTELYWFN